MAQDDAELTRLHRNQIDWQSPSSQATTQLHCINDLIVRLRKNIARDTA
jgi:hypothetical protein